MSKRRMRRVPWSAGLDIPDSQPSAFDEFARRETIEVLRMALSRLDQPLRRTMTMLFVDGLPRLEVARIEGITPQAVTYRRQTAIAILGTAFARQGRPLRAIHSAGPEFLRASGPIEERARYV